MDIHEINSILREKAVKAGLYDEWQTKIWNRDLNVTELLSIFKRGIDFSIKNDWLDYGFCKMVFTAEELHESGIYIDEEVDIRAAESGTYVLIGECTGQITFRDFSVGNVYVRHTSDMRITSIDMAKVFVSVYDDANAECVGLDGGTIKRYDRRK